MFYPLKFKPVYKDYVWGGRNLEKLGKVLPEGIVAESWEVSCHPDGVSVISNGEYEGTPLPEYISAFGRKAIGAALDDRDVVKFPLLVKFIDAADKLSVQVHPDDAYAQVHENGEYGKNEMWYILCAKPGAELIYDLKAGTTRELFKKALIGAKLESCLKRVKVKAGDVINIPTGIVHAIGDGIVLAEVQQNSNTTYRIYDYGRTDRKLHIEKALEVIDFNSKGRREKYEGLQIEVGPGATVRYLVANRYFSVELVDIKGSTCETADGSRFFIYVCIKGHGIISCNNCTVDIRCGDSVLIPASMGSYAFEGTLTALKAYVPDLKQNVVEPLKKAGYTEAIMCEKVGGLAESI